MSHISSHELFADLALSAKTSKILSGLVVNYHQSQIVSKTIPIATMASEIFLAQQGLYVSSFIHQIIRSNSDSERNASLKPLYFEFTNNECERTFVHTRSQSNSKELSLDNRAEWGELLIAQLANSNLEIDLANWIVWTDNRGYLYFQPTPKALSTWLKMLFDRTYMADQDSEFSLATTNDDLLDYIKLRCNQVQKLTDPQINPWIQGALNCTQTAELELIYGIIQVYDSLYMGAKYKIVAAGKFLAENFLEFDRTCRLLDLDPHSPEFHGRAGLIVLVRSAVRDLLTSPTIIDRP
jgi:hypothetical protein